MIIKRLHLAMVSFLLPVTVFSMGMGDMKVQSLLDQPFRAEIPLIDVGGVPLSAISVNMASPERFEHVGFERAGVLSLLTFQVTNDPQGQPVIAIRSTERIPEPYLQMVVDLAWANGQIYRSYTVLLDPPDYKLPKPVAMQPRSATPHEAGVIDRPVYTSIVAQVPTGKFLRKQASYGPTMANEDIWQIAQRYSTPETTLPQIILAIVGTNSDAFTQGNLNGLKVGARLKIPSTEEILKVPVELARKEVEAQDLAWKNKAEIRHVLLPPYIDGVAGESQFTSAASAPEQTPKAVNAGQTVVPVQSPVVANQSDVKTTTPTNPITQVPASISAQAPLSINPAVPVVPAPAAVPVNSADMVNTIESLKNQLKSTTELIDSVRKENTLVKNQLQQLEKTSSPLQKTVGEQNKAIAKLRMQLQQVNSELKPEQAATGISAWLFTLPATAVLAGWGLGYLANRRRRTQDDDDDITPTPPVPAAPVPPAEPLEPVVNGSQNLPEPEMPAAGSTVQDSAEPVAKQDEPMVTDIGESLPFEPIVPVREEKPVPVHHHTEEYILEFESGLDKLLATPKAPVVTGKVVRDESVIDYVPHASDDSTQIQDKPVDEEPVLELPESAFDTAQEEPPSSEEDKLIKSTLALDTLLDLAKTYISMGDVETARQSLQEVMDFGNENQQAIARQLLDNLKQGG